jgi:Kef-type K+ transport system membrane component KefB
MSTTGPEVAHVLVALGLLLIAAHGVGHLFAVLHQPRVMGELTGGLLLGPSLFAALAPGAQAWVFPVAGSTAAVIGWSSQLGMLLLMFCSGAEMRSVLGRDERRVVAWVTVTGVALPFLAGIVAFRLLDPSTLMGKAQSETALLLVFALAIAVTSIPVISRIMLDLGVIDTSFARVVLGVAVLEDVIVYVVLALALGLAAAPGGTAFGLPGLLDLPSDSTPGMALHTAVTLAFFVVMLTIGGKAFSWSRRQRWNLVANGNLIAYHLILLFGSTLVCLLLGITPLFGALLAGIAASAEREATGWQSLESIKAFSFAYFVPIYFAAIGLGIDLVHDLDVVFFAWFLLLACVVKSASVYLGARLSGESRAGAGNLAVATNARGGPGIVLASVTYAAGIINAEFYAALVMLAVVTSMLAGTWLAHMVRLGRPLRDEPRPAELPLGGRNL